MANIFTLNDIPADERNCAGCNACLEGIGYYTTDEGALFCEHCFDQGGYTTCDMCDQGFLPMNDEEYCSDCSIA